MADISITILGLGRLGTSIGLALKRYNERPKAKHQFSITAYSANPDHRRVAKEMNAFDTLAQEAFEAVKEKDIVVIAMPYGEVKNTYDFIAKHLRKGVVILDFSVLKQQSQTWADKYLPEGVHRVGVNAVINPKYMYEGVDHPKSANADYFDNGVFYLMPSVNCIPEAIDLGSDFGAILGSKPQFIDAAEQDVLVTGTTILPKLLGVAYAYSMMNNSGWTDFQRHTNGEFGAQTVALFDTHPDDLRDMFLHNKADLLRMMDHVIASMSSLREVLADNDVSALEAVLGNSAEEYEAWINRRNNNNWDDDRKLPANNAGNQLMQNLFGGFIASKLGGDKPEDD